MSEAVQLVCNKDQKNDYGQRINPQPSEKKAHSKKHFNDSVCSKVSSCKQLRVFRNVNKIENIFDYGISGLFCQFVDKERFHGVYERIVGKEKEY